MCFALFLCADVTGSKMVAAIQAAKEWDGRVQACIVELKEARKDPAAFQQATTKAAAVAAETLTLCVKMDAELEALRVSCV